MVLFRVIVGSIWVSILLIARELVMPAPSPVPSVSIAVRAGATMSDVRMDEWLQEELPTAPRLDLYGNPIESAVGDYRTDPRGDLYERHAPDTAVLELDPAGV